MLLLALETSQTVYSLALTRRGEVMAAYAESTPHRQAEDLIPAVARLLEQAALPPEAVEAYALTVGPGSFTGIRTALAAALGMALVTGRPIYGLSTLETAAWQLRERAPGRAGYLALVNAYRGQWYSQRFDGELTPAGEPMLTDGPPPVRPGDAAGGIGLAEPAGERIALPRLYATAVAELAAYKLARGLPFLPAEPLYIREPDAKLPKPGLQAG